MAHKLIAEALAELGVQDRTIFVSPVGCSVFAYYYFDMGNVQAAHGRAPAVATAVKRANPESIVISYQGDGDLAAIGTAEIIHAANRGEKITVFFVNNSIYGMTGGQMAPTTLVGQTSTTSPWGRRPPMKASPCTMCELLADLGRRSTSSASPWATARTSSRRARRCRRRWNCRSEGAGFTLVEILSPCPTILKMDAGGGAQVGRREMLTSNSRWGLTVTASRRSPSPTRRHKPTCRGARHLDEAAGRAPRSMAATRTRTRMLTIKIAGFGGQGVLLLGQIMAEMGMREGMEVSWLPSYGPEMRSGSAHCHVCSLTSASARR